MIYWGNPQLLLSLAGLPLAAWLLVRVERRRAGDAARFADAATLARLMPAASRRRAWLKGAAALLGLACLIVAAARPRFGVSIEETSQRGADLLVLLDVSRSMLADDLAPSRLDWARWHLRGLVRETAGDRVGLVAFAGQAALKAPLTADRGFLREVLEDLDPRSIPRGGTRIGDAIRKALEILPPATDRDQAIVLISDGEDHDSRPIEAAQEAARRNVKVFTVALGDPRQGARVPKSDGSGGEGYLLYEGREVWSKTNETLLGEIAATTGGVCLVAGGDGQLRGPTWKELLASLSRRGIREAKRVQYAEQFQWFLGAGLLLLAMDFVTPRYPRQVRRRSPDLAGAATAVVVCLLALPGVAQAGPRESATHVKEAVAHYEAGDYAAAAAAFARADAAFPNNPRIAFDLAAALAAQGDADQAAALLTKAAASSDREAALRARYNLGCLSAQKARLLLGSRPEQAPLEARQQGLDVLTRAAGHFRGCLELDENYADARHNLEVIRLVMGRIRAASRASGGPNKDTRSAKDPRPPQGPPPDKPGDSKPGAKEGKPDNAGDDEPPSSGASGAEADPARRQAEKLISRVRQRTDEKRQWDRKRLPERWSAGEEKDW